jgi:uncharacterized protein (DUF58 family)
VEKTPLPRSSLRLARRRVLWFAALALLGVTSAGFAASLKVETIPENGSADVGQPVTLTITLTGSRINGAIRLPKINGLTLSGSGMNYDTEMEAFHFFLTPTRAGDFTIPGFDIRTQDGEKLHVPDIKIHAPSRPDNSGD